LNELAISKKVKEYQEKSIYYASAFALGSFLITGNSLAPLSVFLLMTPSAVKVALNSGLANYLKLLMKTNNIKEYKHYRKIQNSRSIVFDKTGTLTKGRLKIEDIEIYDDKYTPEDILKIAASCEGNIYHPVSAAFTNSVNTDKFPPSKDTVYIPSKGILSNYEHHKIVIGNEDMMVAEKISIKDYEKSE